MADRAAIESIVGRAGLSDALDRLSMLPPNEAQSALLYVYERLAARTEPGRLLGKYEQNRFAQPGRVPPERMLELMLLAYRTKPEGFESIELSPATVLGAASAFGCVSQHKVVSAARGVEILSDATNALALECARRRKRDRAAAVHLCAAHRLMRAQKYTNPGSLPHFNMFSLASAGRGAAFEPPTVQLHVDYHIRLLRAVFGEGARLVLLLGAAPDSGARALGEAAERAASGHPGIRVERGEAPTGGAYYRGFRFQIGLERPGGNTSILADGGACDWAGRLLSDGRERLIASGMPLEALAFMTA